MHRPKAALRSEVARVLRRFPIASRRPPKGGSGALAACLKISNSTLQLQLPTTTFQNANLRELGESSRISRRRARYYGGKPFCPKFFEWNDGEALKKEMELDSVPTDILSGTEDKMSVRTDKMHPLNKRKNKNNNNNENVVVGDSVRLVLKSAAKATGASGAPADLPTNLT